MFWLRITSPLKKSSEGKMRIFSKGFIYRTGTWIKERGERMAHVRPFGIPVLRWCCGPVIALGLAIRESALNSPIVDFPGGK
jgi:hypothetical protein